jgi:hypothetical protein
MIRQVIVTQIIEVEVDETKFTEAWMEEWRQSYYSFNTVERHIEHIAQLEARSLLNEDFTEGYGPLSEMGIQAKVLEQEQEIISIKSMI